MPTDGVPSVDTEFGAHVIRHPHRHVEQFVPAVGARTSDRRLQQVTVVVQLVTPLQIAVARSLARALKRTRNKRIERPYRRREVSPV